MRQLAKATVIIVLTFLLIIGLSSCKKEDSDRVETYYAYRDGVKQDNDWIKLEEDSWSDSEGESGRLEEKDGVLYCYTELFGEEDVRFFGSITDGAFEFSLDGKKWDTYYMDGSNVENKNSDRYSKDDSSEADADYIREEVSGNAKTNSNVKVRSNADEVDDYLEFGTYPQTEVGEETIIAALNGLAGELPTAENSQNWTSYDYYIDGDIQSFMWYIDRPFVQW